MRTQALSFFSAIIVLSATTNKDKNHAQRNLCEELHAIGFSNFRVIVMAVYSQKFPNGTFEDVSRVVNDMMEQADQCCRDGADPDCNEKEDIVGWEKSCGKDSPLCSNADIVQCCSLQVQERSRCLLKLHYSEDQLPSLLQLSHEEICAQYSQDPSNYTLRYVYEFARRHRSVPAGFLLNVTQSYVKMAKNCCSPTISTSCFLQERYQQRGLATFLRFLTNVCYNNEDLKYHKTGLTAYYGNLLQVQFEEASTISQHFQSGLAKCCFQSRPRCVIEEFASFQKVLCKESILSSTPEEFKTCCGKAPFDTLTCVDSLKRRSQAPGNVTQISGMQLCEEAHPENLERIIIVNPAYDLKLDLFLNFWNWLNLNTNERYLFQIGVKYASVSLPVLTTIQDQIRSIVETCCSDANDINACLEEKVNKLEKTVALLSKTDGFCSQYFKLELPAFKAMVAREVQGAEDRAQAWVELMTSCCVPHSPAHVCQKTSAAPLSGGDRNSDCDVTSLTNASPVDRRGAERQ